ncbi:MAG: hypothetical protein FJ014_02545 [Chloroflexi bacterium]|nr:hypothetical protein [Chloroflexota bacterium]
MTASPADALQNAAIGSHSSGGSNRLYFLDNLRAATIWLVIVLHASITYMAYPPQWWYVLDKHSDLTFTQLVLLIDVPIMPILFFVAGYFAYPSLRKRGTHQFLKEKAIRVGAPWVLGALLLAPPTTYIGYWSLGTSKSLWEFWAVDFWSPFVFQQSVYWFLGMLMLLFALLCWIYEISPRMRALEQGPSSRPWLALAVFSVIVTGSFLWVNLAYPIDAWTHGYLLVFQPVRVPLYLGYFCLGVYAHLRAWFTPGGYCPRVWTWGVVAVLAGLGYLTCRLGSEPGPLVFVATGVAFNIFCLTALMTALALFRTWVNGAGRFWRSQAVNSYGIYYVHPLILYPLAYLLVSVELPLGVKAALAVVSTVLLAWGISAAILKRAPLLSEMF